MRITLFAKRNTKEILRDTTNLFFGLGFPLMPASPPKRITRCSQLKILHPV